MTTMLSLFVSFSVCFVAIHGHGYLLDPVARSTAWLVDPSFKQCCTYNSHMEMYCGGLQHQWNTNRGKCGICGEPFDRANKLFEKGGAMYTGRIVKTYTQGQEIETTVVLTANHRGYFEYRVCSVDANPNVEATQECLDRRVLKLAGSQSTRFGDVGPYGSVAIKVRLQLPSDLACRHCVFQWRYVAANNWGTDPVTGQSGLGMGVENETFFGCSDITIIANGSPVNTPPPVVIPNTTGQPAATTARPATTTTSRPSGGATTWSSNGVLYRVGDVVFYDGAQYRCVHDHTSYPGAEPGIFTWAWWQRLN